MSARVFATLIAIGVAVPVLVVRAAEDGEVEVKLADCPEAVQKTLKRESTGGKIEEIEKETEDGKTVYEAEIVIDGKEYEVEVAEDGTLLSKVLEGKADDDGDDDGDDDDDEDSDDDDDD